MRDGAFFQASKALERAINVDDKYVLAHARLAESLFELDYIDQAKDELLRVTSLASDRSLMPKADALYVDAISAIVRHDFPVAIKSYATLAKQSSDSERPQILVDLGRAYEKSEDIQKAIESYSEASNRNPQYATAFLRLGILYGRQKDLAKALSSLNKAEGIYQAMGNLEGRTEAVYQRGALLNQLNKLSEARTQLEQALALARSANNTSQEIRALLQLSTLAADSTDTAHATDYAREAVDLAQSNGMENFSAQGLTDLGFSYLVRGESGEAEKYFLQALESAHRTKARVNEARARAGMASLRQLQNKPDEVLKYVEPALAFYQQGGYSTATSLCLVLVARANVLKGDYTAARKAQEQILQLGERLNDQSLIAQAHEELGWTLKKEEQFTEALDHFAQAGLIYNSLGVQRSLGYGILNRAEILGSLGRYGEAKPFLDQAAAIADKPAGNLKRLSILVNLASAEIDLSRQRFADARDKAANVLATGTQFDGISLSAMEVLGMAQAYDRAAAAGKAKCAQAIELAKQDSDPSQLAKAQLALAETMLLSGETQGAAKNSLQAREVFSRLGKQASEWRALVIAALASGKSGDKNKAREHALQAEESLSKLEQRWGKDNYNTFLYRPDVQRLRKKVDQYTRSSPHYS